MTRDLISDLRVVVIDDEPEGLRALARTLRAAGCRVAMCANAQQAVEAIAEKNVGAVVSDVMMPDISGIDLLREIRNHDLDLPVILVTGAPAVETAALAVNHGAFGYLVKPVSSKQLNDMVARALRSRQFALVRREASQLMGDSDHPTDLAGLEVHFERAMSSLYMAYQPIVWESRRDVLGYEAFLRFREQAFAGPPSLFRAAEKLSRVNSVSRAVWEQVSRVGPDLPSNALLFVNLHPEDLRDEILYAPHTPFTQLAHNVVLEISEHASFDDMDDLAYAANRLRALGFRIAIDDLGAGHSGLRTFAQLEPELVKLDMSLVRRLHLASERQRVVATLINMCRELRISVVAEGVESPEERDCLVELGCDYLQGYQFAEPGPPFPSATW